MKPYLYVLFVFLGLLGLLVFGPHIILQVLSGIVLVLLFLIVFALALVEMSGSSQLVDDVLADEATHPLRYEPETGTNNYNKITGYHDGDR